MTPWSIRLGGLAGQSECGCPKSLSCPKTPGLAVPLRLVLRTQPRSVPVLLGVEDAPLAPLAPGPDNFC